MQFIVDFPPYSFVESHFVIMIRFMLRLFGLVFH